MAQVGADRIEVQCACGKRLNMPVAAAGRRAKCPKCANVFVVPGEKQPAASAPAAPESDVGLLGELARQARSAPTAAGGDGSIRSTPCPLCSTPMAAGARICVSCGYDTQTGRTMKAASAKKAAVASAVGKSAKWTGRLALGVALSAVGALIGAAIWAGIGIASERQFGLIGWVVGILSGVGMRIGFGRENVTAGLVASLMAVGGIIAAKVILFVVVIAAALADQVEMDARAARMALVDTIAEKVLDERGLKSEEQREAERESALAEAQKRVDAMSNAEVEAAGEAETLAATSPPSDPTGASAGDSNSDVSSTLTQPDEDDAPSLTKLFFLLMFRPMDGLFMLLAVISAWKIGVGASDQS